MDKQTEGEQYCVYIGSGGDQGYSYVSCLWGRCLGQAIIATLARSPATVDMSFE